MRIKIKTVSFVLMASAAGLLTGCATPVKPAPEAQPPAEPSVARPAAETTSERFLKKAAEYEKSGDLRRALQMLEISGSLNPDDKDIITKTEKLKARVNTLSEQHFKKGVSYLSSNSFDAARKEFILALFYNPGHKEALSYIKESLDGTGHIIYEVKEGDTPETVAGKVYNDPQKDFLVSYFAERLTPGISVNLPVIEIPKLKEPAEKEEAPPAMPPVAEEPPALPKPVVDIPGMLKKANNLFKAKKYSETVSVSEKILEHDSGNKAAKELFNASSYQMGKALTVSKKYQEAINYFNRVEPGYKDVKESKQLAEHRLAEVHYVNGVKHFVNDEFENAIKEWDITLKLNPNHQKAKKDTENAQALLKKLKELR